MSLAVDREDMTDAYRIKGLHVFFLSVCRLRQEDAPLRGACVMEGSYDGMGSQNWNTGEK